MSNIYQQLPLVSIIINNYNYVCFLKEAIDSALNQTYLHVEVIVVDDGSTDNSQEVITSYGNRIIPVLKENGGQASAINAGFAVIKGEIAIFLDADDVLLPDIVQRVVAVFQARPGLVKVQYRLQVINVLGEVAGEVFPSSRYMLSGDLRQRILKFHGYTWPNTSGNAFATSVLYQILPMTEGLFRGNPDEYLNNLSVVFGSIVSLDKVGAFYRVHGKNNYYQARNLIDFVRLRQIILRTSEIRVKQRELFKVLYSIDIPEVESWNLSFLKDRVVSLKLDPLNHPFKESLLFLCMRGCICSTIYPDMRWHGRLLFIFWFLAMLFVPKSIAKPLTEKLLYPEERSRLIKKMVAVIHTQLFHSHYPREQESSGKGLKT